MQTFRFTLISLVYALALFLGMLLFLELGRRFGVRQVEKRGPAARAGVGVVDGAVYALLALLLGFTFSGATTRYDQRRQLIVQEVSAISTAWARLDVLPEDRRETIRAGLRRYVDAVLGSYTKPAGSPEAAREGAAAVRAQADVWASAVAACLAPGGEPARMLVLPALNEMFDVVERERLARRIHPPIVIYVMLGVAALAAALFAGYSMASGTTRNWMFIIGIAATISITAYVIFELEHPRLGWVRVDAMDEALVELRETMD
jgi:hypothetical protein